MLLLEFRITEEFGKKRFEEITFGVGDMSILTDIGITSDRSNSRIAEGVFINLIPNFFELEYERPSEYVDELYNRRYLRSENRNNAINGKIFEYILATLFIREGFLPLYLSAKVAFVPNVIYDLMVYTTDNMPVCFSAKTSLRERYKQADLEAIALKYVHRRAQSYLITLDEQEAASVREKIQTGDVIGLNNVIVATGEAFDELVRHLRNNFQFRQVPTVTIIETNNIVTQDRINALNG
jgi:hypothetical protein